MSRAVDHMVVVLANVQTSISHDTQYHVDHEPSFPASNYDEMKGNHYVMCRVRSNRFRKFEYEESVDRHSAVIVVMKRKNQLDVIQFSLAPMIHVVSRLATFGC